MLTDIFKGVGYKNALLVRGFEGSTASIASPSRVRGFRNGEDFDFVLLPGEGLKRAPQEGVTPIDATSNILISCVSCTARRPTQRDMVALNAGLALWISERAATTRGHPDGHHEDRAAARRQAHLLVEQHGEPVCSAKHARAPFSLMDAWTWARILRNVILSQALEPLARKPRPEAISSGRSSYFLWPG